MVKAHRFARLRGPAAEGFCNLAELFSCADDEDRKEGAMAYSAYHRTMVRAQEQFDGRFSLEGITGAFCHLSPNNNYRDNLRSLLSLMRGIRDGIPIEDIVVTTWNHCRQRAHDCLNGDQFLKPARGPKISAFYRNILDPSDPYPVTIDGHMSAAFYGDDSLTMQEAAVTRGEYGVIAEATRSLAKTVGMLPNQVQATIWFARKRKLGILYTPTKDLFAASAWDSDTDLSLLTPFNKGPEKAERTKQPQQDRSTQLYLLA